MLQAVCDLVLLSEKIWLKVWCLFSPRSDKDQPAFVLILLNCTVRRSLKHRSISISQFCEQTYLYSSTTNRDVLYSLTSVFYDQTQWETEGKPLRGKSQIKSFHRYQSFISKVDKLDCGWLWEKKSRLENCDFLLFTNSYEMNVVYWFLCEHVRSIVIPPIFFFFFSPLLNSTTDFGMWCKRTQRPAAGTGGCKVLTKQT